MESILRRAQDKVRKILRELCTWKGAPIIEAEVCRAHIHMLAEKPPALPVVFYFQYGCRKECRENAPRHSPKSTVCCGTKSASFRTPTPLSRLRRQLPSLKEGSLFGVRLRCEKRKMCRLSVPRAPSVTLTRDTFLPEEGSWRRAAVPQKGKCADFWF